MVICLHKITNNIHRHEWILLLYLLVIACLKLHDGFCFYKAFDPTETLAA